jgi:uncharacterized protein (TIGR03118 family)
MEETKMRNIFVLGAAVLFSMSAGAQTNNYTVSNLVTNAQDSNLVNPWGLSRAASKNVGENEWWASDQVTGVSTLYYANGGIAGLKVTIPPASGAGKGSPTGTAANTISNSHVVFAFATLDGTISTWDSSAPSTGGTSCAGCHASTATIMVNHSTSGASYQGLTIAKNATSGAETFYAANANGGVEAYDATSFSPVTLPPGAFKDHKIPKAYTPAGIQAIGAKIYVAYNRTAGGGTGYVDAYNTNGKLLLRLQTGWFNQPWGVALAPASFGAASKMILVGNTGSGWIGAYSPTDGTFQGFLQSGGQDLSIPGLWGIEFGNGSVGTGPTNVLYFNGGGPNQTTGVFGAIKAN